MVQLKLKAGDLKWLLQLIEARGIDFDGKGSQALLGDGLLQFKSKGILGRNMDENEILLSIIKFEAPIIEGGNVPVKLSKTIDTLNRYKAGDEITFIYDESTNKIQLSRLKPKLNYTIACIPESDLQSSTAENVKVTWDNKLKCWFYEETKYDVYVSIKADEFKEIIKDGDLLENRSYPIKITPTSFEVALLNDETGENSERELVYKTITFPPELKNKSVSSVYSAGFGQLFNQLSGDIEIWFTSETTVNSAMIVKQILGKFEVVFMLCSVTMEKEDDKVPSKDSEDSEEETEEETEDEDSDEFEEDDGDSPA